MAKIDAVKVWSLNYRLLTQVITSVAPEVAALGVEVKELFVLAEIDEHPHPAALAIRLSMPKPTVTVNLQRLEAMKFVRREIDRTDLPASPALARDASRPHKIMARRPGPAFGRIRRPPLPPHEQAAGRAQDPAREDDWLTGKV